MKSKLEPRFAAAGKAYPRLKRTCEAEVRTWRWATWRMFGDGPYYFERHCWAQGRWLKAEPKDRRNAYQYGFDSAGRVVVAREIVQIGDWPEGMNEAFFVCRPGLIESTHYGHADKTRAGVQLAILKGGCVVAVHTCARGGIGRETFTYEDSLPVVMKKVNKEPGRALYRTEYRFTHDKLGQLVRIEQACAGKWSDVYRRSTKKQSLSALAGIIHARLCELVPSAVARAKIMDRAYCVILAYDWEDPGHCLPPLLAVGLDTERSAQWNPAEYRHFDTAKLGLNDARLQKTCALFTQEPTLKNRVAPIRNLLLDVARTLNQRDWSRCLAPTDDFIVVPVDLECAHVKRTAPRPGSVGERKARGAA